MKLFLALWISFFAQLSVAAELGEITEAPVEGIYQFYKGDIDLVLGERLTGKGDGTGIYFFEVTEVKDEQAWGRYQGQRIAWGSVFRSPEKGDRVRLIIPGKDQLYVDFYFGSAQGREEYGYPGKGSAFALATGGYFNELLSWDIRLGADQWGSESTANIRKQRSYYLFGLGYNPGGLRLKAYFGLLDHLTILDQPLNPGYTDPYTGKVISKEGPTMDSKWGYFLSLGYQFDLKKITRNNLWGWYLLPQATYGNTLSSAQYPVNTSIGLAIGVTTVPF